MKGSLDDLKILRGSYESHIEPRYIFISRKSNRPTRSQSQSFSSPKNFQLKQRTGNLGELENAILSEKRDMSRLNDNFARYLERVRFLQVLNNKLNLDLRVMNDSQCDEAKFIRSTYETEIARAKDVSKETDDDVIKLRYKISELEDKKQIYKNDFELARAARVDQKKHIRDLNEKILANNDMIKLLRRRLADLQDEMEELREESEFLKDEINFHLELKNEEQLLKSKLETEVAIIKEEINALKRQHDKELDELREQSLPKNNLEFSQYFRAELAQGIDKIRQDFNAKGEAQAAKMHELYQAKVSEIIIGVNSRNNADSALHDTYKHQVQSIKESLIIQEKENLAIKSQNDDLLLRIKNIEENIDQEKKRASRELVERNNRIERMTKEKLILEESLENTKRGFQSLYNEIKTYEHLLEGDKHNMGLKHVVQVSDEFRTKLRNSSKLVNIIPSILIDDSKSKQRNLVNTNDASLKQEQQQYTAVPSIIKTVVKSVIPAQYESSLSNVTPTSSLDTGYVGESTTYSYSFTTSSMDEHKIVRKSQGGSAYL